jgi:hypothetical protein
LGSTIKSEDFDVQPTKIIVNGNYREEKISVEPRRERSYPVDLQWLGVRKTDVGNVPTATEDKVIGIQVSVTSSAPFWTTRRGSGVLALIFFILALIAFGIALIVEVDRNQMPGASGASPLTTILVAIGSFAASACITSLNNYRKGE